MKHIIFALIHVHDYKVVNKNILGAFNHVKAEMACSKLCLLLILAVFLLHTGDAANVSRENRKHNRNTRDVTLTSTEQLVNYILQQIEAVLTTLLEGLCNLISPLVAIIHIGNASTLANRQMVSQDAVQTDKDPLVKYISEQLITGVTSLLKGVCPIIAPLVQAVETFRVTMLNNLIITLNAMSPLLRGIPQYSSSLDLVSHALKLTNQTIVFTGNLLKTHGCSTNIVQI
ncbi:unnamed protein product [Acanthoscelides obtectus]|uniref:Uncharacterized protein n=1 Tax=Acanthoscelides obtectus TaxID=200917 RepID=A0A9P0K7X6_ACAOB|nr:unnamed protein product [Acanthoscelides obtectus]CAK1631055.1 hypothetical protein AOBTE_LOCUS6731 [Acanthoscelides obtectus]